MSPSRASAMALHVEAAKRLLEELEQHAHSAREALDRDGGTEFLAAIEERDRILGQLTEVVDAIAQERGVEAAEGEGEDADAAPMFADMARAAAAALESQRELTAHAQRERDRIAAVIHNTNRPDSIANQYAVATGGTRRGTLSITG